MGIDRFNQIRILRKVTNEDQKPKVSKCVQSSLDEVAQLLWRTSGQPQIRYTGNSLRTRLHTIMTPWMNEGFFADVVVLVEGEEDRALLGAFAMTAEQDLEGMGISIIPCLGKNNVGRPAAVFKMLGIPSYIIWDSDRDKPGADPEANRCLLRLLDHQEEDWPALVGGSFACFRDNFQSTVRAEVGGELFDGLMQRIQNEEGILIREQASKNVTVIRRVLQEAITQGHTSATLASILEYILELRRAI